MFRSDENSREINKSDQKRTARGEKTQTMPVDGLKQQDKARQSEANLESAEKAVQIMNYRSQPPNLCSCYDRRRKQVLQRGRVQ